jgi:transcriptional regulator with XRE-family HTH domain
MRPARLATAVKGAGGTVQTDPALSRHTLGSELRRLRTQRSLRLEDAAAKLDIAPSTLCRIETGRAPTRSSYLNTLLDLYGVDDPRQRKELADMAVAGRRKDWWTDYADLLPAATGTYLGLEGTAEHVRGFAAHTVPAQLQTRGYAQAFFKATRPDLGADQVNRLVALQLCRRQPPAEDRRQLDLILDESVLRRSVGSRQVMADQLAHLTAIAGNPSITMRVIRLATTQPVLTPSFTLLSIPGAAETVIACLESIGGQIDITRRAGDVQAVQHMFLALARAALSPTDSATLIGRYASNCR